MKNNPYIVLGAVLVLGIAAFFLSQQPAPNAESNNGLTTLATEKQQAKNIVVTVGPTNEFSFDKKQLTVNKGDTVKVTFKNTGRTIHNWVLTRLNAATPVINPGQSAVTKFQAAETGAFEYLCTVPGHRERGMFGNLKVV